MASNTGIWIQTVKAKIDGESKAYPGAIEVTSWSWWVAQTGSAHSGTGGSTGTSQVGDLTFTAPLDKSFPSLAQAAGVGTHLEKCSLKVYKTGGEKVVYLTVSLTGGLISRVEANGTTDDKGTSRTTMSVTLHFSKIEFEYSPQDEKGAAGGSTTGMIDVAQVA